MLPYVELRAVHVFGLRVPVFGALLTAGVITGHMVLLRRARATGLGPARVVERFAMVVVASGIVAGFVASALSSQGALDGLALSSLPSLAGAFAGALVTVRVGRLDAARYADVAAYAFPFGWLFVRVGCALVHDHIGRVSDSWLAVRFPDGARFDLGVLEALAMPFFVALVVVLGRAKRRAGVLAGCVVAAYGVLRLGLWLTASP